jgi:hypothetical protein
LLLLVLATDNQQPRNPLQQRYAMVYVDKEEIVTEEEKRLRQDFKKQKYWKKWGSYVAERQWATGLFQSA